MSLIGRILGIFRGKAYKAVDAMERVDETVDLAYEDQQRQLVNVQRGIADVTTAKHQIIARRDAQQSEIHKLDGQARAAVKQGRDDLAAEALQRKKAAETLLAGLNQQIEGLTAQEQKLVAGSKALRDKIERFKTEKEVIKANYRAAEATARIGEAATGISDSFFNTGQAIGRAKDKVEQMQARANAIDELTAAGALEDFTGGDDHITRELNALTQNAGVDDELAALKGELGMGAETKALPVSEIPLDKLRDDPAYQRDDERDSAKA